MRVRRSRRVAALEARWNDPGRLPAAPTEQRSENGRHVHRVVDRPAYTRVAQRPARGVDRHVPESERRRGHQQRLALVGLLPLCRLRLGDVEQIHVPRLELGHGGARLGDHARHEGVGFGRTVEVVRISRQQDVVVMPPRDELPRAGADRVLGEIRRHGIGNDRRDRHGQKLRKDRERAVERDAHGRVVLDADAPDARRAPRGVVARAGDREERPPARPALLGVQHALEGARDVAGGEGTTIVEPHAAPQMKHVLAPVGGDVPSRGERRLKRAVGREAREAIEEVGDRASRRHIRRARRVERARVVAVARIDQGAALRRGVAAPARGRGEEERQQGVASKEHHGQTMSSWGLAGARRARRRNGGPPWRPASGGGSSEALRVDPPSSAESVSVLYPGASSRVPLVTLTWGGKRVNLPGLKPSVNRELPAVRRRQRGHALDGARGPRIGGARGESGP